MYHPTTRVLTVLELLQVYGTMRTAELASRLEVSERSVRRYITMLQDLGIPIVGERGRYGGYRLRPGFKLPPLMLTDDEALAVTLGLLAASRLGLALATPAVEGALAKIDRVLPDTVRQQVRDVQDTLIFDMTPPEALAAQDTVVAVGAAARQTRQLWMRYQAPSGETERTIDPYGMVYRDRHWYTVGWCHLRAAIRVFRLDRVAEATMLEETFIRPPTFDCRQYVVDALASKETSWTVVALLNTTLPEAQRWISVILGSLEEIPEGVLFRWRGHSLEQIGYYLLGLPCRVTVLEPPELLPALDLLRAKIDQLAAGIEHPPSR